MCFEAFEDDNENVLRCPRKHPICFECVRNLIRPAMIECKDKNTLYVPDFAYKCPLCRSMGCVTNVMVLSLLKGSWKKAAETVKETAYEIVMNERGE